MATEIKVPTRRRIGDRGDRRALAQEGRRCGRDRRAAGRARDRQGDAGVDAPGAARLTEIVAPEGATVKVGAIVGPHRRRRGASRARRNATPAPPDAADPAPARAEAEARGAGDKAARRLRALRPARQSSRPKPASIRAQIAAPGKDGRVDHADIGAACGAPAALRPLPAPAATRAARARRRRGRRRRAARAHDAAAQAHRRAPQGGAEHRRHAHHLQRGGHERGDGAARALSRQRSRRSTACGWASCRSSSRRASSR